MTGIIAHPILTGSIYPIRSNTRIPVITEGDAEYRLIPGGGYPPAGLLARLFSMIAINRMIDRGGNTTRWDNVHQVFADMDTKESGSNLSCLKRNLAAFNTTVFSTPYGPLRLQTETTDSGLSVTADAMLINLISDQGVRLSIDAVRKLRGKGIGGVPIDLYAWAIHLSRKGTSEHMIPWSEVACRTALADNPNLPRYFAKSMQLVNQVCEVIKVIPTKDGLILES